MVKSNGIDIGSEAMKVKVKISKSEVTQRTATKEKNYKAKEWHQARSEATQNKKNGQEREKHKINDRGQTGSEVTQG